MKADAAKQLSGDVVYFVEASEEQKKNLCFGQYYIIDQNVGSGIKGPGWDSCESSNMQLRVVLPLNLNLQEGDVFVHPHPGQQISASAGSTSLIWPAVENFYLIRFFTQANKINTGKTITS